MIDAIDDLVSLLLLIVSQSYKGKSAKADILLQQFISGKAIASFEVQIFLEGQRVNRN